MSVTASLEKMLQLPFGIVRQGRVVVRGNGPGGILARQDEQSARFIECHVSDARLKDPTGTGRQGEQVSDSWKLRDVDHLPEPHRTMVNGIALRVQGPDLHVRNPQAHFSSHRPDLRTGGHRWASGRIPPDVKLGNAFRVALPSLFDTLCAVGHPRGVLDVRKCLASWALLLTFIGGLWVPCEGWQATEDARMACCMADGSCPMKSDSPASSTHRSVTQAEADGCCASATRSPSRGSQSFAAPALAIAAMDGPVDPLPANPADARTGCRVFDFLPASPAPRHLLLSVFLV